MAGSVQPVPLTNLVSMPTVLVSAYCYTELAVSSLAVAVTFICTHFAYPRRDDQAELARVVWLNTKMVHLKMVTNLSTNPA